MFSELVYAKTRFFKLNKGSNMLCLTSLVCNCVTQKDWFRVVGVLEGPIACCWWFCPSPYCRVPPPPGHIKVNVDGYWNEISNRRGVGIIARNFHGDFVAARVARFENVFSPAHIEALAVREGLSLCVFFVERGYKNFILESDSLQIVTALCEPSVNRFFIVPDIEDAKAIFVFDHWRFFYDLSMFDDRLMKWPTDSLSLPFIVRFSSLGSRNL